MGYFCLSVIQSLYGGRKKAGQALNVDRTVLDTFGQLTSERGDAATARKQESKPLKALTSSEERWIHAALKVLIRRVAMEQGGAPLTTLITMKDLPPI
jgi:hypothetical protein